MNPISLDKVKAYCMKRDARDLVMEGKYPNSLYANAPPAPTLTQTPEPTPLREPTTPASTLPAAEKTLELLGSTAGSDSTRGAADALAAQQPALEISGVRLAKIRASATGTSFAAKLVALNENGEKALEELRAKWTA